MDMLVCHLKTRSGHVNPPECIYIHILYARRDMPLICLYTHVLHFCGGDQFCLTQSHDGAGKVIGTFEVLLFDDFSDYDEHDS